MHDLRLFKAHGLSPALQDLGVLMGQLRVWADRAYEALRQYSPSWHARVQEKATRHPPWPETPTLHNTCNTRLRIRVEHVSRRLNVFRCCSESARRLSAARHRRDWHIVAGLWNQRHAHPRGITAIFNERIQNQ